MTQEIETGNREDSAAAARASALAADEKLFLDTVGFRVRVFKPGDEMPISSAEWFKKGSEEILQQFNLVDSNKDGFLDDNELRAILKSDKNGKAAEDAAKILFSNMGLVSDHVDDGRPREGGISKADIKRDIEIVLRRAKEETSERNVLKLLGLASDRIESIEDWGKEHVVTLKPDASNILKTGDVITTAKDGVQTLAMPNGDTLKVHPDGTYELKTKDGKVKTDEYSGGSKAHQLTYPNGDTINFGNDPTTKNGRIFSVIRDGFFLGIERAADSDSVPAPKDK